MAELSRKQQEIKDRGSELLRIARRLLEERGVNGLTMETLAESTDYSKGTIYQHFSCKEDVLAALCLESESLRYELLSRAALFRGRSRERLVALGIAHDLVYRLRPEAWFLEETLSGAVKEKLSPERLAKMNNANERSYGVVLSVIRDGIASGDLTPPSGLGPEQVFLGLVSTAQGLFLTSRANWWDRSWAPDFLDLHQKVVSAVCDGFNWRPFGAEWDYPETVRRVWAEVFPKELALLGR